MWSPNGSTGAPHEVLLVLDATTGQNAILQAQNFRKAIDVTGIILAKLDGTAKGGVVVAIKDQLSIPVKFIGLGETPQDIETFDPARFIDALFRRSALHPRPHESYKRRAHSPARPTAQLFDQPIHRNVQLQVVLIASDADGRADVPDPPLPLGSRPESSGFASCHGCHVAPGQSFISSSNRPAGNQCPDSGNR
jgi:hypothetical protein